MYPNVTSGKLFKRAGNLKWEFKKNSSRAIFSIKVSRDCFLSARNIFKIFKLLQKLSSQNAFF